MNKLMHRILFNWIFALYIAVNAILFITKLSGGYNWLNQWFFDKFFVFQFISVVILGLVIESKYFYILSYVRISSRRKILRRELLGYYKQGIICLNIMCIFILLGVFLLNERGYLVLLIEYYVRYLLGILVFINVMSCLKWSNNLILNKYYNIVTYLWLVLELILLKPYIQKFYSFDINFLFSWIFHDGTISYLVLFSWFLITLIINITLCDKRDFI